MISIASQELEADRRMIVAVERHRKTIVAIDWCGAVVGLFDHMAGLEDFEVAKRDDLDTPEAINAWARSLGYPAPFALEAVS